jgi:uncharacterized protein (TIGR00251 family)
VLWRIVYELADASLSYEKSCPSMIDFSEKDSTITFKVQVVPRASLSEVIGEYNGALRVRIAAPPVDGAAYAELVRTLSRAFGVKRAAIDIISGQASRTKQVRVSGISQVDLQNLLART